MPEESPKAAIGNNLLGRLTNKVGPLPAWAWAAIPAAAYVAYAYYTASKSGPVAEETLTEDFAETGDEYFNTGYPDLPAGSGIGAGAGYAAAPGGSSNIPQIQSEPGPVLGLTATNAVTPAGSPSGTYPTFFMLSWRNPVPLGGGTIRYEVQLEDPRPGIGWRDIGREITANEARWYGFGRGQTYKFRVRAINEIGPGPWAEVASVADA